MSLGTDAAAEIRRALADLSGAGLTGGDATNAVLTRRASGAYDPATGASSVTSTDHAVIAVPVEMSDPPGDGSSVIRVLRRVIITPPSGVAPARGDRLAIGSVTYGVEDVQGPTLSGSAVSYLLEVRV